MGSKQKKGGGTVNPAPYTTNTNTNTITNNNMNPGNMGGYQGYPAPYPHPHPVANNNNNNNNNNSNNNNITAPQFMPPHGHPQPGFFPQQQQQIQLQQQQQQQQQQYAAYYAQNPAASAQYYANNPEALWQAYKQYYGLPPGVTNAEQLYAKVYGRPPVTQGQGQQQQPTGGGGGGKKLSYAAAAGTTKSAATVGFKKGVTVMDQGSGGLGKGAVQSASSSGSNIGMTTGKNSNGDSGKTPSAKQWPPNLVAFVEKAFESCATDEVRNKMEDRLKLIIKNAFSAGMFMSSIWDTMPIPDVSTPTPSDSVGGPAMGTRKRRASGSVDGANGNEAKKSVPKVEEEEEFIPLSYGTKKMNTRVGKTGASDSSAGKEKSKGKKAAKGSLGSLKSGFAADAQTLSSRARRFKDTLKDDVSNSSQSMFRKIEKQHLMPTGMDTFSMGSSSGGVDFEMDWKKAAIKGTCETVVKEYFRLTSAPDPAQVRPLHILKKSLDEAKKYWKTKGDYYYACRYLKSIRQDLTVQCIRNNFTVKVYEVHARIALEKADVGEFNQCQSQLKELYKEGNKGHESEFIGYRILYFLYTGSDIDMGNILRWLRPQQKREPAIAHALKVREAHAMGDYVAFFKLYKSAPNMGSYLLKFFVNKERDKALKIICKGFGPSISIDYITAHLEFETPEECIKYLEEEKKLSLSAFTKNKTALNCKESYAQLCAA
eukprot:Nk52_evm17s242 gene=Nk52_evmTU17s242